MGHHVVVEHFLLPTTILELYYVAARRILEVKYEGAHAVQLNGGAHILQQDPGARRVAQLGLRRQLSG